MTETGAQALRRILGASPPPRHTIRALAEWARNQLTLSASPFRMGTGRLLVGDPSVSYKQTKKYTEGAASFNLHDPNTGTVLRVTVEMVEQGGAGR